MAETFKFVKKYPLNQGDIDDTFKVERMYERTYNACNDAYLISIEPQL